MGSKLRRELADELRLHGTTQQFVDFETYRQERRWQHSPEQWLQLAILDDCIGTLRHGPHGRERAREYADALMWVEDRRVWAFSFAGICEAFDFDEDRVRKVLLAIVPAIRVRWAGLRPGGTAPVNPKVKKPMKRKPGYARQQAA
jgi:hypothetical protein